MFSASNNNSMPYAEDSSNTYQSKGYNDAESSGYKSADNFHCQQSKQNRDDEYLEKSKASLNDYIYDFFKKSSFNNSADTFAKECKSIKLDMHLEYQENFLGEWWQLFWDLFNTTTKRGGSEMANDYFKIMLTHQNSANLNKVSAINAANIQTFLNQKFAGTNPQANILESAMMASNVMTDNNQQQQDTQFVKEHPRPEYMCPPEQPQYPISGQYYQLQQSNQEMKYQQAYQQHPQEYIQQYYTQQLPTYVLEQQEQHQNTYTDKLPNWLDQHNNCESNKIGSQKSSIDITDRNSMNSSLNRANLRDVLPYTNEVKIKQTRPSKIAKIHQPLTKPKRKKKSVDNLPISTQPISNRNNNIQSKTPIEANKRIQVKRPVTAPGNVLEFNNSNLDNFNIQNKTGSLATRNGTNHSSPSTNVSNIFLNTSENTVKIEPNRFVSASASASASPNTNQTHIKVTRQPPRNASLVRSRSQGSFKERSFQNITVPKPAESPLHQIINYKFGIVEGNTSNSVIDQSGKIRNESSRNKTANSGINKEHKKYDLLSMNSDNTRSDQYYQSHASNSNDNANNHIGIADGGSTDNNNSDGLGHQNVDHDKTDYHLDILNNTDTEFSFINWQ